MKKNAKDFFLLIKLNQSLIGTSSEVITQFLVPSFVSSNLILAVKRTGTKLTGANNNIGAEMRI